ncbi:carboxypeptidase-like regulatory domain-containing protein [Streptomyces cellulosae]
MPRPCPRRRRRRWTEPPRWCTASSGTPEGEPVRGASVTLLTPGGRQLDRVVSLADGAYVVAVPSPGTYLLAVSASSHGARAAHVTVGEGPHVHDVELTPGGVDVVN